MNVPYRPPNAAQPSRWFPVKNTSGSDAPANAVLKVTGVDANGVITAIQPDAPNIDPAMLCIADAAGVKAGKYGRATNQGPWYAATSGSPAVGDNLGTVATTWTLATGQSGFVAWTAAVSGIFLAMPVGGGSGGDDYALLDAVAPGSTTPYVTDLTNSVCFYSATLWTGWNSAGGANQGLTFGEAIWLFGVYNPIVYTDTAPGTPFKLDGHSVHKCKYTGKSYNPTDGAGAHGSRRVFFTTEAGWAWGEACDGSGPPETINAG